ncbi:carboxyltransferase domain-containing protein [Conexibacter woesei]|uniref:Urea carboxylase n=1 Tax=Conexibacter woesei (strain DSM 14684 / CCUG 47730 / CIP 108061 / JCM 11494 / NBRC 100937 / ID131577) TaxID=469383 RepID=D3F026_CONWI|nr:carboxyltransferase domain-containing protein [Conexibacter woesei]ADB50002.1 Urea carboxylase [Conexibacter woesei DSM 14684]
MSDAIIERRDASGDRPPVVYRQAGDRHLLLEYGAMELDLQLNFRVLGLDAALRGAAIDGVLDSGPGLRSILVRYDSTRLPLADLIAHLDALDAELPSAHELEIPSRRIRLPIAFDDAASREAVRRYARTVRDDAPNVAEETNIDYVVAYNGLPDREALYAEVLGTEWWNAFTGFFPGLPFMYPLDPRHALFAPKYNPTRTWTAEGAVGIGGPCVAIYPVESPGGYQLFGRTLPIYDLARRNRAFAADPILIKPGDRVVFERVGEEELLQGFEDVRADRYNYAIEESPFDVERWLAHSASVADEADARRAAREAAAAEVPVP